MVNKEGKLNLPDYTRSDDFIRTVTRMLKYICPFGMSWTGRQLQRTWSDLIIALILIIFLVSAKRLFGDDGCFQIVRLSGTVKFFNCLLGMLMIRNLRKIWPELSGKWTTTDYFLDGINPSESFFKRTLWKYFILFAVLFGLDRFMTTISAVDLKELTNPSRFLEDYITNSHSFVIPPEHYNHFFGVMIFILMIVSTVASNCIDFIVLTFSLGLVSRQLRINHRLKHLCKNNSDSCELDTIHQNQTTEHSVVSWRKMREIFVHHRGLVESVNSAIGPILLLSTFKNSFYIIILLGLNQTYANVWSYYCVTLCWVIVRFFVTLLNCANLNDLSKQSIMYLKTVKMSYYNVEVRRLQFQLNKDEIALSGMGFFKIKRSFILKVFSIIITYVLMLIQYSDHLASKTCTTELTAGFISK